MSPTPQPITQSLIKTDDSESTSDILKITAVPRRNISATVCVLVNYGRVFVVVDTTVSSKETRM
jgi:hypothetical protein